MPKEEETEKVTVVAVPPWRGSVCVCHYEQEEGLHRTKRTCLPTQMTRERAAK